MVVLIYFSCSAIISSIGRHSEEQRKQSEKGPSRTAIVKVLLEELRWLFLSRQLLYTSWLHLIKTTAETATLSYWMKRGCFLISIDDWAVNTVMCQANLSCCRESCFPATLSPKRKYKALWLGCTKAWWQLVFVCFCVWVWEMKSLQLSHFPCFYICCLVMHCSVMEILRELDNDLIAVLIFVAKAAFTHTVCW